jgi:hypothetical protein
VPGQVCDREGYKFRCFAAIFAPRSEFSSIPPNVMTNRETDCAIMVMEV